MVTFLQRTFTSLVHAHAGRTQGAATENLLAGAPKFPQSTALKTMMRKLLKVLSSIGLIISVGLFYYSSNGPYYETTPLKSGFSFSSDVNQIFEFVPERTDRYMVDVVLRNNLPMNEMEDILGSYVNRDKVGKLDVEWTLRQGNEILAAGSNKEYGYSHIFMKESMGVAIGMISLISGLIYTLSLKVNKLNPEWNVTEPLIKVGLNSASLEYLIGFLLVGILFLLISGLLAVYLVFSSNAKRH